MKIQIKESAPVTKTAKTEVKVTTPQPVVVAEPKPQKPKIAGYSGPTNGKGNGATKTTDINTRATAGRQGRCRQSEW